MRHEDGDHRPTRREGGYDTRSTRGDSDSDGGGVRHRRVSVYAVWRDGKRWAWGAVEDIEEDASVCPGGTFQILIGLSPFMAWIRKNYRFRVDRLSEAEIDRIARRFTRWDS